MVPEFRQDHVPAWRERAERAAPSYIKSNVFLKISRKSRHLFSTCVLLAHLGTGNINSIDLSLLSLRFNTCLHQFRLYRERRCFSYDMRPVRIYICDLPFLGWPSSYFRISSSREPEAKEAIPQKSLGKSRGGKKRNCQLTWEYIPGHNVYNKYRNYFIGECKNKNKKENPVR